MGIIESLILIFLAIFVVGLILSVAIWVIWLAVILTAIFVVVRFVSMLSSKISKKLK